MERSALRVRKPETAARGGGRQWKANVRCEYGRRPSSPLRGRRLLNFLCHAHDGLLHAVLTGPVDADLMAIGIVQIGVTPTPWHHARHLCYVEALGLQFAAKLINFANLEVQPHTV